jgi:hypothetical protein
MKSDKTLKVATIILAIICGIEAFFAVLAFLEYLVIILPAIIAIASLMIAARLTKKEVFWGVAIGIMTALCCFLTCCVIHASIYVH